MHPQKRKELGEKLKVLTLRRSVAGIATLSFEDWALQFPVYQYVFNYIVYIYITEIIYCFTALYIHILLWLLTAVFQRISFGLSLLILRNALRKIFAQLEACDVYECPSAYEKRFGAAGKNRSNTDRQRFAWLRCVGEDWALEF